MNMINVSIMCYICDKAGNWSSSFLSSFSTGEDEGIGSTSTLLTFTYNKCLK